MYLFIYVFMYAVGLRWQVGVWSLMRERFEPIFSPGRGWSWKDRSAGTHMEWCLDMFGYVSTLWWTNKKLWKMAIEIVDFPINSMVIFHCKLLVHQRVGQSYMDTLIL